MKQQYRIRNWSDSVPDKKLEKVMKVGFYQNYDTHQKPYASI
jgi:hypothetical protein